MSVVSIKTGIELPEDNCVHTIAWRPNANRSSGHQVLLFTAYGVLELAGLKDCAPIGIRSRLELHCTAEPATDAAPWQHATCCAGDGSKDIFFATRSAVWRLDEEDCVTLIAGAEAQGHEDGPGPSARFEFISSMALGPGGALYVVDSGLLRIVSTRSHGLWGPVVSTLQLGLLENVTALAYDPSWGVLYLATRDGPVGAKVYKVQEPVPRDGAVQLEPFAAISAFTRITSMAVTSGGDVLLIDSTSSHYEHDIIPEYDMLIALSASGNRVAETRNVHWCTDFLILPTGGFVLYSRSGRSLWLWPSNTKPPRPPGTVLPCALCNPARLAADLASLRSRPSVPPDVTVLAGGRTFPAHRVILAARCEYFARLFAGGFSDSADRLVELPDADPDAFEQLLSYMYGGELRPAPCLLRPLAELADRLLLLEVGSDLLGQLLQATGPCSVVEDMLWAERRGLSQVLEVLKEYYLTYEHVVIEEAPESLERLVTCSPKLHLQLHATMAKRARRR